MYYCKDCNKYSNKDDLIEQPDGEDDYILTCSCGSENLVDVCAVTDFLHDIEKEKNI